MKSDKSTPLKITGAGLKTCSEEALCFEEFLTCVDNMDSSNVSELKIIHKSSDAKAKDLNRTMQKGCKVRDPRGPRPYVRAREALFHILTL